MGVSERVQGDWTRGASSVGDYALLGIGEGGGPLTIGWVVRSCAEAPADRPVESRGGESWFLSGSHFTGYNHSAAPNAPIRDCSLFGFTEDIHWRTFHEGVFPARSRHAGGVQALFLDGGVRFVRDAVDRAVWRALATRSGAEVISAGLP